MNPVPVCKLFGNCGGCARFETDYRVEAEARRADIESLLQDALGGDVRLQPFVPPRQQGPRHFRLRALYPLRPGRGGRLIGGLYARGSHRLVEIDQCETQDPRLTELAVAVLAVLRESGLPAYREEDGTGFLRALDLRVTPKSGECLITIATKGGVWDGAKAISKAILRLGREREHGGRRPFRVVGIVRSLHDEPGNRLLGQRFVPLAGREYTTDQEAGLTWRVSAGSFYQTNRYSDRLLYRPVIDRLAPLSGSRVVDVFSGVGSFGLRLARAGAARVDLVEENPIAVRDAEANIRDNGLAATCFAHRGGAAKALGTLAPEPDLVVLDPPRSGLGDAATQALLALEPAQVCYVSCYPKSLANDLKHLVSAGYTLRDLHLADMFPRTDHAEVVAHLGQDAKTG